MASSQFKFTLPAQAMRFADDNITVGKHSTAKDALQWFMGQRRLNKQFTPDHEALACKFVDLAVDLRDAYASKDGLINFRYLTQQHNPASLDRVVRRLIDRALSTARSKRDEAVGRVDLSKVDDLDAEQTPEELLMSSMTSEGAAERAERELVVPWVRHAWDVCRNTLDTLRNIPKLEGAYQFAAFQAFEFCQEFGRTTEFRKLCESMRKHLNHWRNDFQKWDQSEPDARFTLDNLEKHMTTRFRQLQHCAELSMWSEGFRTVDDIYSLVRLAPEEPDANLMAQYYAQVAKIFWKSDDLLFHAYATLQQFKVVAAQHGVVTAASGTGAGTAAGSDAAPPAVIALANKLICAALCVPLFADSESEDERFFHIDFDKDKKDRLAKLLNFADTPSRPELLATLGHMGVAHLASPAIGALLATLESTFHPLGIVKAAEPALVEVKADAELSEYAPALERLTLYRLLAQLTQVYSHITMEFFEELVAPLTLSGEELELEVARGCKAGLLQVRLDHCGRSIRLGQESMESDRMRSQLTALATALADVLPTLPTESGGVSDLLSAKREQVFKHAAESEDGVVTENLDRLAEIEARRREQARKAEIKKRQADAEAAALAKRQAEHEAARVAADELRRKNEKIKKLEEEMHIDAVSAALVEAGQDPKSKTHQELLELTVEQVEAEAQRKLVKSMQAAEKRREKRRLEQGFLVRAMREREQDELDAWVAAHMSVDSAYAEMQQELMRLRAEKLHEQTQLVKRRLARMMPFLGGFEDSIFQQRKEAHAAALVERRRKARADAIPGKVERARKLKQEKDQEEARLRQAELDRRAAEEHKRAEDDWRRAGPSAAVSARPPPRAEKDLDFGSLRRGPSSTPAPAPAPRDDLDFSAVRGGSAPRPSDAGPPPPVSHNIRGGRSSESSFSRWSGSSQSGERSTSSGAFGSGPKPSSGGAGGKWR